METEHEREPVVAEQPLDIWDYIEPTGNPEIHDYAAWPIKRVEKKEEK